jgi:thioredoxin-related protein
MKTLSLSLLLPFLLPGSLTWLTNLDDAKQLAKTKHEFILLNFSGSDWCGPCIKMDKDIFESDVFQQYADSKLVLVNADFPRSKKNQLAPGQQKLNDALADKYNPKGIFPYTLLLDSGGNVLKAWEGFYEPGSESFVYQIKNELSGRTN